MAEERNFSKSSQIISVRLNGAENYLLWSRQMLMHLKGQRLTGYVTGTVKKSVAVGQEKLDEKPEFQKWEADDGQVMSWLINSMEGRLQSQFMMLNTARQAWDRAAEMYSKKGNHGQIYHLQSKSDSLVQKEMSVTEYFSELSNMWEQMDFFDPLAMTCSLDALAFTNWLGKRRTFRFLAGLNPDFEQVRQSLWQRNPLPALRDAFAVVVQEESRRKAMISLPVQEGSAMMSQPYTVFSQGDKFCDHYHRKNHNRETCWDLHGRPARGRGRDGGRGRGQGSGRGPGRGGGYQKAHVADSISTLGSGTNDMVTQLVTQLAARLLSTTSASSASPNSALFGLTVTFFLLFLPLYLDLLALL